MFYRETEPTQEEIDHYYAWCQSFQNEDESMDMLLSLSDAEIEAMHQTKEERMDLWFECVAVESKLFAFLKTVKHFVNDEYRTQVLTIERLLKGRKIKIENM